MFSQKTNLITISTLTLPLAFFQQQEPAYALPEGAIGVEYVPSSHHVLTYPDRSVGRAMPWVEGNAYLSKVETYRTAWEASQVPAPPSAPVPDWRRLKGSLRGSELFAVAFGTTSEKGFTLFMNTLDGNEPAEHPGRLADFQFAIAQIRTGLAVDYTPEQVSRFNQLLAAAHFRVTIA